MTFVLRYFVMWIKREVARIVSRVVLLGIRRGGISGKTLGCQNFLPATMTRAVGEECFVAHARRQQICEVEATFDQDTRTEQLSAHLATPIHTRSTSQIIPLQTVARGGRRVVPIKCLTEW